MTESVQELVGKRYRANVPAVKVMKGTKGARPLFLFTVPLGDPAESAKVIKSLVSQLMESADITTSVSNRVNLPNGQVLQNVHAEQSCEGRGCSVHHPSDHHMGDFSQHYRADRGLMERLCEHHIGHPDPDDKNFHEKVLKDNFDFTHGCDGCCRIPRKPQAKKLNTEV